LASEQRTLSEILRWCSSILGPCEVVSGSQRDDARSLLSRLRTGAGYCYLKVHRDRAMWEREVYAYEQWATVFGACAPPLLGVHEGVPLALVIGELEGAVLQNVQLASEREREAWRAAGRMLARLHAHASGSFFGSCDRSGAPTGVPVGASPGEAALAPTDDAQAYVATELAREMDQALHAGLLDGQEKAALQAVQERVPAFAGERPVPCHRDYCPYNWLVTESGTWVGVIDFEFAHWDVRVADFSRYPDWEWIGRPDLVEALLAGYGRSLTPVEEQQCLVYRALYALSAINWGTETGYLGFAREGHEALSHLVGLL
jgi:Ser/Thr protein kinase RdoA (MazF antagonist)